MQDFDKHKANFFSFLDSIKDEKNIGIISHANCIDGVASVVFLTEILNKKYSPVKTHISFLAYGFGALSGLESLFYNEGIKKVFILDLNADIDMFDEFEDLKLKFDVCFIDHHLTNPKLKIDNKVIKTSSENCTALVIYKFGEGIIDYEKWSWLACVSAIAEFSYKNVDNLKFIQAHYPDFSPNDPEKSSIFKTVNKLGSLVIYYSKDSLKVYEAVINEDFGRIDQIHEEVSSEMERCLRDFEENAEKHFDGGLYFYFFKSKFYLGSKMSTILSVRHRGSTIVAFSEISKTNMLKMSARNNADKLPYFMSEMFQYAVNGIDGAMGAGHPNAAGGSFLAKDLDKIKERIKEFVEGKLHQ